MWCHLWKTTSWYFGGLSGSPVFLLIQLLNCGMQMCFPSDCPVEGLAFLRSELLEEVRHCRRNFPPGPDISQYLSYLSVFLFWKLERFQCLWVLCVCVCSTSNMSWFSFRNMFCFGRLFLSYVCLMVILETISFENLSFVKCIVSAQWRKCLSFQLYLAKERWIIVSFCCRFPQEPYKQNCNIESFCIIVYCTFVVSRL